jgi:hypothetical protein
MPIPTDLSAADLLAVTCEACNCGDPRCGLLLESRCHPNAGVEVKYFKAGELLQITCKRCDRLVTKLHLAGRTAN